MERLKLTVTERLVIFLSLLLFRRAPIPSDFKSGAHFDVHDFSFWSLGPEVLEWCYENVPHNSRLLELGSGLSTRELSKYFKVTSLEHDVEFLDRWDSHYIHAPLECGYYQARKIVEALSSNYMAIIVDGPPANSKAPRFARCGIQSYLSHIRNIHIIIVDDIHRFFDFINFLLLKILLKKRAQVIRTSSGLTGVLVN